ncbi:hypothetical protein [Granulicella tundricola]|nr:hypothetical protein [Granulicella tundricola]
MKIAKITCTGAMVGMLMLGVGSVPMLAQASTAPVAQQPAENQPSLPTEARQGGRGGQMGGPRQVEMLTKQLSLTDDQVTKLKAIDADGMQQMQALRADTATPQEEKRPKMMAIRQAQETKIKAMLTDEQKTKYDAMIARMRERRAEGDGPGGSPPTVPPPSTPPQP